MMGRPVATLMLVLMLAACGRVVRPPTQTVELHRSTEQTLVLHNDNGVAVELLPNSAGGSPLRLPPDAEAAFTFTVVTEVEADDDPAAGKLRVIGGANDTAIDVTPAGFLAPTGSALAVTWQEVGAEATRELRLELRCPERPWLQGPYEASRQTLPLGRSSRTERLCPVS